jgi:hypothetical protein
MPSFDVVSEINDHELTNALDQANRELANRFDFKGSNARVERAGATLTLIAPAPFQVRQMTDILHTRVGKRGIDVRCLKAGEIHEATHEARLEITVRQGIDKEMAKTVVKLVKDSGLKLQAAIQGEQVRVTGKKKDDLQQAMALIRAAKLDLPVQFTNFRD